MSGPADGVGRVGPALLVAVTAISFAAILFRLAAPTHPLVAAAVRLSFAAGLLAPAAWRAGRRGTLDGPAVRDAALAGLAYAVHFGAWVWSLGLTTIAASVTLVTSTPLVLAVVGLATGRDAPTGRLWIALALGAVGVAVLGGGDLLVPGALAGDALAALGAVAMAAYLWVARRASARSPRLSTLGFQAVATATGAAALWLAALLTGVPLAVPGARPLAALAGAALLPQLVGHGLLTWALRHTTPTVVGISTLGEPVGSTALGWLWLDEIPAPTTLLGCAVTLAGVTVALTRRRGRP